ncbi:Anaphase-promoting complex subunit 2 [Dispira parvispora]|uniref:Anaphase-promoting complex subunit 2 n=1 Tax=Dispira parvispora TaxID=1520584 RepID=A0A9W8AXY8_9FUNG|nr:Anaphase-promoting complex subunit 2 [Dispira parvispora]
MWSFPTQHYTTIEDLHLNNGGDYFPFVRAWCEFLDQVAQVHKQAVGSCTNISQQHVFEAAFLRTIPARFESWLQTFCLVVLFLQHNCPLDSDAQRRLAYELQTLDWSTGVTLAEWQCILNAAETQPRPDSLGKTCSFQGTDMDVDLDLELEELWNALPGAESISAWTKTLTVAQYYDTMYYIHTSIRLHAITGVHVLVPAQAWRLVRWVVNAVVTSQCTGDFESSWLGSLLHWVRGPLVRWILTVNPGNGHQPSLDSAVVHHATHVLHETYRELRVTELFRIIVDYPDSLPALQDLKVCLAETQHPLAMADILREDIERRLLHQGVNTLDILAQYIACIKSLRVLDPTSVMAQYVTQPIRAYVRTREDTIHFIVASLVGDDTSLFDDHDLAVVKGSHHSVVYGSDEEDEDNDFDNENWEPEPMEALVIPKSARQRHADVITMLTSIYESHDVLIKEYQRILANKLLQGDHSVLEEALRNLELLKIRFGETSLNSCEVMLKDMGDSRRINQYIHEALASEQIRPSTLESTPSFQFFTGRYLSHLFWPNFREETWELPPVIKEAQQQVERHYQHFKPTRKLHWQPQLGTVELTLTVADHDKSFSVSPFQATLIYHFGQRNSWTIADLATAMNTSPELVRARIGYWITQGVLQTAGLDKYQVVQALPDPNGSSGDSPSNTKRSTTEGDWEDSDADENGSDCSDEEANVDLSAAVGNEEDAGIVSNQDQRAEEMRIYWSFVVGMLTNLGALSLDRIQGMLSMFVQDPAPYSCNERELEQFLALMVREDKLELSGGQYRLK